MKLYCFYTSSYEVLLRNWFLPSVKDDFEIVLKESRFQGEPINYKRPGWHEITLEKVEKIIEAIQENWEKPFIFSDPDVQFFRAIKSRIEKLLVDKDIVIQRDGPQSPIGCTGFFALKGNPKTLKIRQDVHERMRVEKKGRARLF